ncbi:transcriptional regulator [Mesorhizobium sp. L-8-10]|nr:transcriptional regulator [Mesorhizobium sp. L-8-3]BCH33414.1 transcriptional regulator [Mesorhizobium sp. L-8-10]
MSMQPKNVDSDAVLKALAHPVRRKILAWLKEPERHFSGQEHPLEMGVCAGQFERCGLSQSTVSAHLATLAAADLVTTRRVGQWVFYKRNEDTIGAFRVALSDL